MARNLKVASALIIREGKILLGERMYKRDMPLWVAPGGRLEDDETVEEGPRREIFEEVGIKHVTILKEYGAIDGVFDDEQGRDAVYVFLVQTDEEPRLMEPEKFREWKWFAYNELPDNLPDPQRDLPIIKQAFEDAQHI
jgi:8-oxo-dGTP diphosphatase